MINVITNVSLRFAFRCLVANNWNYEGAAAMFANLKVY